MGAESSKGGSVEKDDQEHTRLGGGVQYDSVSTSAPADQQGTPRRRAAGSRTRSWAEADTARRPERAPLFRGGNGVGRPESKTMAAPPNVDPLKVLAAARAQLDLSQMEDLWRGANAVDLMVDGNQCCRMCFCQPENTWTIYTTLRGRLTYDTKKYELGPPRATVKETSPWLGRCFAFIMPGNRPITYELKGRPGSASAEHVLVKYEKGCTLGQSCFFLTITPHPLGWLFGIPFRIPLCCCLPYLTATDAAGQVISESRVVCDHNFCVPKIVVKMGDTDRYLVRPDTCAGGCCPVCTCDAPGQTSICLRSPFYIFDPTTGERLPEGGRIRDPRTQEQVIKMGICTRANLYTVEFPHAASAAQKSSLLGAVLLLDKSLFEQDTNLLG